MISLPLITDHVVVSVEHLISPDISNIRVVPGLVQAIPHFD